MTTKINIRKSEWKKIWNSLPFSDFPEEYFKQGKKEEHTIEAEIILNLMQSDNVGLIADTAAGKTIMSILVLLAGNLRTLFLAPQVNLTTQHKKMFDKITGKESKSRFVNGTVAAEKRIWNDLSDRVVFATPHVVIEEIARKKIKLEKFDLIIFDEMHEAVGNYPYVPIAKNARRLSVPPIFLGLSASPGENEEWLLAVEKNLFIDRWHIANIKTPLTPENLVLVEIDETLGEIDTLFQKIFLEISEKINLCSPLADPKKILTWSELEWLKRENERLGKEQGPNYFKTILNLTKYRKLYYMYSTALSESYATFLGYCREKLEEDRSRSGMEIFSNPLFQKVLALAKANIENHPKAAKLLETLASLAPDHKNGIIFVSERRTGEYLHKLMSEKGYLTETVYGGITKNARQIEETLEKLKFGRINFLLSTSVIEQGTNISEAKNAIHYSMPRMGKSRKQRGGRTGRLEPGDIFFIALNHPQDRIFFYQTARKVRVIDGLIKEKSGIKTKEPRPPAKKINKKKEDELTLPLF